MLNLCLLNKTIKRMIYKKMQEEDDWNYIQYIPSLVKEYNNRVHSAFRRLKLTPEKVHNGNKQLIYKVKKELYGDISNNLVQVPKFKRGDYVRVALKKGIFEKQASLVGNYTEEVFIVSRIQLGFYPNPTTYKLEDLAGETLKGTFIRKNY